MNTPGIVMMVVMMEVGGVGLINEPNAKEANKPPGIIGKYRKRD